MIKSEPKQHWQQSRVTVIGLSILTIVFSVLILSILITTRILNKTYSMFAELVLLFGLALNVFGCLCISSAADSYLGYWRYKHFPNAHRYVERQDQIFYPDLPARDRFRINLVSLIVQIIYFLILNILTLVIARLVLSGDAPGSSKTFVNWLWILGAGLGFVTILFDAAALARLYVAFIMLKQEQMTKTVHSNLELLNHQAVIEATFYEEEHHGTTPNDILEEDEEPF